MRALNYISGTEREFEIGQAYYFGQLWDGEIEEENELLESGAVSQDGESVVAFEAIEKSDDLLETLVKVTDIY